MSSGEVTSDRVALVLQVALLGEVSPALRRVGFDHGPDDVTLRFFYDGPISDDDRESASCVETEVMAALPDDIRVTTEVERVDAPARLPTPERLAYSRRE